MRATYSASTCGLHHIFLRQGCSLLSARRRRTVSRETLSCSVSLTRALANRFSVQRARPSGGLEQAVATNSASSLPVSLRPAPGRGSSLSAASRLPSTKRRLVRYTVEPPTPTLLAISSSLAPASAASKICARLSLRTACRPPPSRALSSSRSVWLSSTGYRMFICAPCAHWRRGRTTESDGRSESFRKNVHAQTGAVPGVYPPVHAPASPAPGGG